MAVYQWSETKERLEERLCNLQCYEENNEQWKLSVDQIKDERDKVKHLLLCGVSCLTGYFL